MMESLPSPSSSSSISSRSSHSVSLDDSGIHQSTDVLRILRESASLYHAQRYIVSGGVSGIFLLWVAPTSREAQLSLDGAHDWALEFLSRSHRDDRPLMSTFYHGSKDEMKKHGTTTTLLILSQITEVTLHTDTFTLEEENFVREHPGFIISDVSRRSILDKVAFFARNWTRSERYQLVGGRADKKGPLQNFRRFLLLFAGTTTALLVILFVFAQIQRHTSGRSDIWMRYDTRGSNGPRYQLQFNRHNVTDWVTPEQRLKYTDNTEWAFRIDDQAMIPAHLYTPEEDRYQKWFQHRYPEKDEVRVKELYLNQTFLSDPYAIQVPSDEIFHTAHCVLALRRYWWAKESGAHVCPRDIDYRHMKHCLDSLDELAFPGGLRGPVEHPPEPDDTVLIWKTKVCF